MEKKRTVNRVVAIILLIISINGLIISLIVVQHNYNKRHNSEPMPAINQQLAGPQNIGEITDETELEKLWQEYFYDSIATISNTWEFNKPEEIEPENIAMFCWFKYIDEYGKESLATVSQDSMLRVFPLEKVLEYAERYFNITTLDVSDISEGYYDSEKQAFTFNLGSEQRSSYKERNPWGVHLDKVTRHSDGSITAEMISYDTYENKRPEMITTLSLQQREDGSFYFIKGKREFVDNHLVTITGEYNHFDKISGFTGNLEALSMIGEVKNTLIFAHTPYDEEEKAALLLVNPNNLTVEKTLPLNKHLTDNDFKLVGDKLRVLLPEKIAIYDYKLELLEEVPLPNVISDKIKRETEPNNNRDEVVFCGYDVSKDMKWYVYADEEGVKLLNSEDKEEKLLAKSVPTTFPDDDLAYSYHCEPSFVAEDKKVITVMSGYEGTMGYTLCDLESDTCKKINISAEVSSTGRIRYDTGILEVNTYLYDEENQSSGCKTLYLDFKSGEVREIKLEDPGDTGYIRFEGLCYVGQDYAAFVTSKYDFQDNANNMSYINRLDLKTLTVEPPIISVEAAETNILGVLPDGRVIFYYDLNPSERGVCITK